MVAGPVLYMKLSSILGLNARTSLFSYRYSDFNGKKLARSKLLTKRLLARNGIPIPEIYKVFRKYEDVFSFDWKVLPNSFALKPSKGMGGEGIIVIRNKSRDTKSWITTKRARVTIEDLKIHTIDTLEGAYSIGNVPDVAFCEEYVGRHRAFRKFAYRGTPDIRVLVFNKVPVMAMLRLPTHDSGGRANLHQGAIGVGVDIGTGITTHAVRYGEPIRYKPGTQTKLHGIKIPYWNEILITAVKSQIASGLGYLGVDIVLHPERGPLVLEINSQPGLQIQIANVAGLRKRLDRVEDLKVHDFEHGVKIAKALFSAHAVYPGADEDARILGTYEDITVKTRGKKKKLIPAKIDTGAWRTAIDRTLAQRLGLLSPSNVLWTGRVRSAMGSEERPIVNFVFYIKGVKIATQAGVTDRKKLKRQVIVGRRDLPGFLIDPKRDRGIK